MNYELIVDVPTDSVVDRYWRDLAENLDLDLSAAEIDGNALSLQFRSADEASEAFVVAQDVARRRRISVGLNLSKA